MLAECYECGGGVDLEEAQLIKFGLTNLIELNDELESRDFLEGSDEIGDFYICCKCWDKLGSFVEDALKEISKRGVKV